MHGVHWERERVNTQSATSGAASRGLLSEPVNTKRIQPRSYPTQQTLSPFAPTQRVFWGPTERQDAYRSEASRAEIGQLSFNCFNRGGRMYHNQSVELNLVEEESSRECRAFTF